MYPRKIAITNKDFPRTLHRMEVHAFKWELLLPQLESCEASCSIDRLASAWRGVCYSSTRSFFSAMSANGACRTVSPPPPSLTRSFTHAALPPSLLPCQARTFYGVLISANRMNKGDRTRSLLGGHLSRICALSTRLHRMVGIEVICRIHLMKSCRE